MFILLSNHDNVNFSTIKKGGIPKMKLVSFLHEQEEKFGVVTDNGIVDLGKKFNNEYKDLKSFIANNGLDQLGSLNLESADFSLDDVEFIPVIANPDKIICAGVNYDEHRIEANREEKDYPTIFFRVSESQIGHNEEMILPKESDKLDFEGEIAVVIGKEARRVSVDDALDYVVGYSCYNDGTIRDWQRHAHQWGPGKNFNGTGAFGPWLVTKDEIADDEILTLETRVNGEVMQHADTDLLIFSIRELIAYCSNFTTLKPGDVIVTGTPGGVGAKRKPPVFLKDGDVVEIEVSKIGTLKNKVKAE